ncbi:MAG TPA: hybrid sensor histidine kinase/response regulator [Bacteroidetes bacterium]|nr:hybrid sensor histidine kinase/response regulator [Bacteroidota bacterium]
MAELKVLIVDDEAGIRSGVSRILNRFRVTYPFMDEAYTYKVLEAETGEKGLEIIDSEQPDIVLLDNKLPGISGVEVLDYIKQKNYDIVVAMITSYASLDVALRATRDGATDFIPKPFTPQELKSSIENITKQQYLKRITSRMKEEGKKIRFRFLSVLSHELKSPLNAVEGYLNMMRDREAGNDINDYAEMIERSIQRIQGMRTLIMDLLDFTKIKLEVKKDKVVELDPALLMTQCVETINPLAIQKDVSIVIEKKSDVIISADEEDMNIIFNNLLSNAVKYNKEGGQVVITIDREGNDAVMEVKDTGIGISSEDQQVLFNEFVRIKNDKTRNIAGSGLGLSIVKKIADLYQGSITVASRPDEGSVFKLKLPVRQEKE